MPHIILTTNKQLTKELTDSAAKTFGQLIVLISGKTEERLMLDFQHSEFFYFQGEHKQAMNIDVRLFGKASIADKEEFTKEITQAVSKLFDIELQNIYLQFAEYENWGVNGILR